MQQRWADAFTHDGHSRQVKFESWTLNGNLAAFCSRFTRSKTLIDHGALIDCADKNGSTPLHIAAQYGHDILANALLSYGASPTRKG